MFRLQHKSTHIRVQYQDSVTTAATQTGEEPKFFRWCGVEEDVQIEVEQQLEKIEVPKFDECKSSVVIHDFHMVCRGLKLNSLLHNPTI